MLRCQRCSPWPAISQHLLPNCCTWAQQRRRPVNPSMSVPFSRRFVGLTVLCNRVDFPADQAQVSDVTGFEEARCQCSWLIWLLSLLQNARLPALQAFCPAKWAQDLQCPAEEAASEEVLARFRTRLRPPRKDKAICTRGAIRAPNQTGWASTEHDCSYFDVQEPMGMGIGTTSRELSKRSSSRMGDDVT